MSAEKKVFVVDTNVILHESGFIEYFEEHDLIVPITVLEELDGFKRGTQITNYNAREFVRFMDSLGGDRLLNDGVSLGEGRGRMFIKLEQMFHEDLEGRFPNPEKPDHKILNIAYHYSKENEEACVIILSKDVNLRMKAHSIGLKAQDYTSDYVSDDLPVGYRWMGECPTQLIDCLYEDGSIGRAELESTLGMEEGLTYNEGLILQSGRQSALAVLSPVDDKIHKILKGNMYGIEPRNAEQTFASHALCNPNVSLVALTGKAGTGKTILALAAALEQRSGFHRIFLARPIIPLSNKDVGYLPGDIQAKINPYMQPLHDNLNVIRGQFSETGEQFQRIQRMLDEGKLMIEPLAYIRGRSLGKVYFIVDEAQNLTPLEIKTIVTRAGEGTKFVFTGDIDQIDHPYVNRKSNGLAHLVARMHGQKLFSHVELNKGERSELAELASNLL